MSKLIVLVILVALRIVYQPTEVSGATPAFENSVIYSACTSVMSGAKVISLNASVRNNKVYLNWSVSENETADMFEVEKSMDGKNFVMAALVFSTEQANTGNYEFYEKAGNRKLVYRIKLISKDNTTGYSPVVSISPVV